MESLYLKVCELRGIKICQIQTAITYAAKHNIFLPCDSEFLTKFAEYHKIRILNNNFKKYTKMKTLDAVQYSQKRDELLGLIEKVLTVEGIKAPEKQTFIATQKRLQENQFNFVLIGEFQGGKSTTFNALCDGREISPRGAMNKTSAICITATNLADKNEDEYAIVNWKTDSDKLKLMESFVGLLTPEDLGITLNEDEQFSIEKYISFKNPRHLDALKEAIETQEKVYSYEQEYYEVLRIAKLIIAFSTDKTLDEMINKNRYNITDVSKFAIFPDRWDERWTHIKSFEDIKNEFSVEDVLFAFVGEIQCHIHSANLAQLGCSITDCPGLFASSWDTSVALNALSQANAVIYLLGGGKQMGEGDEKAISIIFKQKTLKDKVFFALNKKQNDTVTANIIKTNESKLVNLGISDVSIWNFSALLFFLSEFGKSVLSNKIDDFSMQQFLEIAKRNGYEEVVVNGVEPTWLEMVSDQAVTLKKHDLKGISQINSDACETIETVSRGKELISTLNNSIIAQKAESILIDNGAKRVGETLEKIDTRLKSIEDDAIKTVEQAEAEFLSAQRAYEVFETKVTEILSSAFPDYLCNQLAQNAYIEITQPKVIDNIALKLAIEIPKKLTIVKKANAAKFKMMEKIANGNFFNKEAAKQKDKAKKELEDVLEPAVKSAVQTELTSAIEVWQNSLNNGTHTDYKIYILPQLDEIVKKINAEWDKAISKSDLLKGYCIPKVPLENSLQAFNTSHIANSQGVVDATARAAIGILVKNIITEVVAILSSIIIGLIVDLLLFGGMGQLWGAIYACITYVWTKIGLGRNEDKIPQKRDDLNRDQKKIYDRMRPSLGDTFQNSETRTRAVNGLKECPQNIFDTFAKLYRQLLNEQKNMLETDIKDKRASKQQSMEKQQEIAAHAKSIRENQIQPLERMVSVFIDSCY